MIGRADHFDRSTEVRPAIPNSLAIEMAELGREVISALLVGPADDGRLVYDSPVRGDVWAELARADGDRIEVLIEAYRNVETGLVAARLARRLYQTPETEGFETPEEYGFGISYVEGFVAARLGLKELIYAVLPFTTWARELRIETDLLGGGGLVSSLVRQQLLAMIGGKNAVDDTPPKIARLAAAFRVMAALHWALGRDLPPIKTLKDFFAAVDINELAERAEGLAYQVLALRRDISPRPESVNQDASDVFAISRNRPVELALERSIPAVKADAVSTLFAVSCARIGWAIIDTGVDSEHPAFRDTKREEGTRVVATYDFTRLRDIVSMDHLYNPGLLQRHVREFAQLTDRNEDVVASELTSLARDAQQRRPINWAIAEAYVAVSKQSRPANGHGTHVAGILGGSWSESDYLKEGYDERSPPASRRGVCPDIRLYDFRVVTGREDDTEFAVVGALQFIRYLNGRNNFLQIHGANISLSIRHDVRNYACGRTPVCEEAERTVNSGVVVVAAAGNRGHQSYQLTDGGTFETYAPSSITDPGNAEAVITVGATHRSAPHSYGVSFFSSRGPTGDGRAKPDLVAPGEKIWSVVPGVAEDALSGTSMAAPHVSGAAALIMARNAEFIGQAGAIKRILCNSCTDLGREKTFQGAGMLDILRAMQSI